MVRVTGSLALLVCVDCLICLLGRLLVGLFAHCRVCVLACVWTRLCVGMFVCVLMLVCVLACWTMRLEARLFLFAFHVVAFMLLLLRVAPFCFDARLLSFRVKYV